MALKFCMYITGVITPISGVITLLITGKGPPCTNGPNALKWRILQRALNNQSGQKVTPICIQNIRDADADADAADDDDDDDDDDSDDAYGNYCCEGRNPKEPLN